MRDLNPRSLRNRLPALRLCYVYICSKRGAEQNVKHYYRLQLETIYNRVVGKLDKINGQLEGYNQKDKLLGFYPLDSLSNDSNWRMNQSITNFHKM